MAKLKCLVNGVTARQELSPCRDPRRPLGRTRYSAILRAMGLSGCRFVCVEDIRAFLASNPRFSERMIYKRRPAEGREG